VQCPIGSQQGLALSEDLRTIDQEVQLLERGIVTSATDDARFI
jgi:hypothetical protein